MKHLLATLLLTSTATAPAAASSFVMLKQVERQPSPSILLFVEPGRDEPAPARAAVPEPDRFIPVSRSIVAMGEAAVEATTVASIEPDGKHMRNPHLPPMVIRAGLGGDAFVRGNGQPPPRAATPLQASAPARPASAPGQQQPEPPGTPPPQQPAAPKRLPR